MKEEGIADCTKAVLSDADATVCAAASFRLWKRCKEGRKGCIEVARSIDEAVATRLIEHAMEGEDTSAVHIALLTYAAAISDDLQRHLTGKEEGPKCIGMCAGILRSGDPLLVRDALRLLVVLSSTRAGSGRVSVLLADYPFIVPTLVSICRQGTDIEHALRVMSCVVSTQEGTAGARRHLEAVTNLLLELPPAPSITKLVRKLHCDLLVCR
ncbi:hypothetical protein DIPPA_21772 [Diplonema papillatum]|nr:hypothetical protein DIPPA_21772 [Diplonema papillatum]|eukprot:gene17013-26105_t